MNFFVLRFKLCLRGVGVEVGGGFKRFFDTVGLLSIVVLLIFKVSEKDNKNKQAS